MSHREAFSEPPASFRFTSPHSIENMLLLQEKDFETPDGARAPMDVAEFYDSLETKRMARLDGLVQQYNSIESLLIKVGLSPVYLIALCCIACSSSFLLLYIAVLLLVQSPPISNKFDIPKSRVGRTCSGGRSCGWNKLRHVPVVGRLLSLLGEVYIQRHNQMHYLQYGDIPGAPAKQGSPTFV